MADSAQATGLKWGAVATTVTTTRGDLIARGASADGPLAKGRSGQRLRNDGTDPSWGWDTSTTLSGASPTYTITDTDGFDMCYGNASSGTSQFTLPAAGANNAGRVIRFKNKGSASLVIVGTIDGNGSSNVNSIRAQYGTAAVISDGTAWHWYEPIREAGFYSAVFTNVADWSAITNTSGCGHYSRSGSQVVVTAQFSATNTDSTRHIGSITVPIQSTFTSDMDGCGMANFVNGNAADTLRGAGGIVYCAFGTSATLLFCQMFPPATSAAGTVTVSFMYTVK